MIFGNQSQQIMRGLSRYMTIAVCNGHINQAAIIEGGL